MSRAQKSLAGNRIRALDGVRGVAVILVVIGHVSGTVAPYTANAGVTLFFVLSGFLITSLLLMEKADHGDLRLGAFYMRRVLRLYPALLVVIAGTGVLLLTLADSRLRDFGTQAVGASLYVTNIFQASGVGFDYFTHMWSLAVEEQFYLVWPILLVAIFALIGSTTLDTKSTRLIAVVATLTVLAFTWRIVATLSLQPDRVYYAPDTNAFLLLLGCLLAVLPRKVVARTPWVVSVVAMGALIAMSLVLPGGSETTRNWVVLVAGLLAVPVVAGSIERNPAMSSRLFVWFGTISYGLYLWHFVLLGVLKPAGIWRLAAVAVAVLLAWLSFRFVERPIHRRFKTRWERERLTPADVVGHANSSDR